MAGRKSTTWQVRFNEKVGVPDASGCTEWFGGRSNKDPEKAYGLFYADGQMRPAHRWLYEQANKVKLPIEIDVCHKCDKRLCVTLNHLFEGTRLENMADMLRKGRSSRRKPRPSMQGAKHPGAKLNAKQVLKIREAISSGSTLKPLALKFKVSMQTIHRIAHRQSWSYL